MRFHPFKHADGPRTVWQGRPCLHALQLPRSHMPVRICLPDPHASSNPTPHVTLSRRCSCTCACNLSLCFNTLQVILVPSFGLEAVTPPPAQLQPLKVGATAGFPRCCNTRCICHCLAAHVARSPSAAARSITHMPHLYHIHCLYRMPICTACRASSILPCVYRSFSFCPALAACRTCTARTAHRAFCTACCR